MSILEIESPSMPRASHHATINFTLAQWAALMRAGIIDCVETPIDVENGQRDAISVNEAAFSRRQIGDLRYSDSLGYLFHDDYC